MRRCVSILAWLIFIVLILTYSCVWDSGVLISVVSWLIKKALRLSFLKLSAHPFSKVIFNCYSQTSSLLIGLLDAFFRRLLLRRSILYWLFLLLLLRYNLLTFLIYYDLNGIISVFFNKFAVSVLLLKEFKFYLVPWSSSLLYSSINSLFIPNCSCFNIPVLISPEIPFLLKLLLSFEVFTDVTFLNLLENLVELSQSISLHYVFIVLDEFPQEVSWVCVDLKSPSLNQ